MKLPVFIAWRYLFSGKKRSVINLISWVSLIGITVSTIALVVVMSVYNGIGELTQSLFNIFDPELIVQPTEGKTFHTSAIEYDKLKETDGVVAISPIVEENAWMTVHQAEAIVQLRGVDDSYGHSCGLDTMIFDGVYLLKDRIPIGIDDDSADVNYLLLGWNIMVRLGVNSLSNTPIALHIPKRGTTAMGFSMDEAFNNGYAYPSGAFRVQEEIDNMYVVTGIDFVRQLMNYSSDEVTALAVSVDPSSKVSQVKKELRATLGNAFTVKDRYEQKPLYYKIFRSERLGVFLILSLIVLIAALNLVASLSLLILNKHDDVRTLRAMGMESKDLRRVFRSVGILIAAVGVVIGLLLGFVICLVQQHFGIVKLGANAIVDAFPVAMRLVDFFAAFGIVMLISSLVVFLTVRRAKL